MHRETRKKKCKVVVCDDCGSEMEYGWEEDTSYDEYKCPHCGIVFREYVGK